MFQLDPIPLPQNFSFAEVADEIDKYSHSSLLLAI